MTTTPASGQDAVRPPDGQPVTVSDLARELGTTTLDLAHRVTELVHELGPHHVVHTAHPTIRHTALHPAAADTLRARHRTEHHDDRPGTGEEAADA